MSQEIADTLTEMENCFQLLMPDPFNFGVNDIDLELSKRTSANEAGPASPLSCQGELNPSSLGCIDDEQPCCSKDILPVSQSVTADGSTEVDEKPEQKEQDGGTCSDSGPALEDDDYQTFVRNHGLISHKYTLDLEVSTGTWKNFWHIAGASLSLKCSVVLVLFLLFKCWSYWAEFCFGILGHHFHGFLNFFIFSFFLFLW